LAPDVSLGGGVNASTKFGGTAPLKIWDSKKRPKFSTFYDNFRVRPQISLNWIEISTQSKRLDEGDPFGVEKKICEIPSTTNKVVSANVDLP